MKALISTIELRQSGYRVAQVEPDDKIFPLTPPLFWADCPDDMVADRFWYNPATQGYEVTPAPEQTTSNVITTGTTTF
jgi:hypothetical protein